MEQQALTFEPTPSHFRRAPGDPRDYAAEWDAFEAAHYAVMDTIAMEARAALDRGDKRIEVRALFTEARRVHKVNLNNSWCARCADRLMEIEPRLAGLIRRRARKATP